MKFQADLKVTVEEIEYDLGSAFEIPEGGMVSYDVSNMEQLLRMKMDLLKFELQIGRGVLLEPSMLFQHLGDRNCRISVYDGENLLGLGVASVKG